MAFIQGTDGADTLTGTADSDRLEGLGGSDGLLGGGGPDQLFGGDGGDQLFGQDGDDYLLGGAGRDALTGGAGRDVFAFDASDLQAYNRFYLQSEVYDIVVDRETGIDVIDFTALGAGAAMLSNGFLLFYGAGGIVGVRGAGNYSDIRLSTGTPTLTTGTNLLDDLTGTSGPDVLDGLGESDVLYGLGGPDVLLGGAGRDTLFGGDGPDVLNGGAADVGQPDRLTGGEGRDVFILPLNGRAEITDFETGVDLLDLGVLTYTQIGDQFTTSIVRTGINTYVVQNNTARQGGGFFYITGTVKSSDLIGGGFQQQTGLANFDDDLVGAGQLFGLSGNDRLEGGALMYGDAGADTLIGSSGVNNFAYRSVQDSGTGAGGFDTIVGFEVGIDKIDLLRLPNITAISISRAADGSSILYASTTEGQLQVGVNVRLNATDVLTPLRSIIGESPFIPIDVVGTTTADVLIGGGENNRLFGLDGADTLIGGNGDDTLTGDAGADRLEGGGGADRFAYRRASDSGPAGGFDTIVDFNAGDGDRIDFTLLEGVTAISLQRYQNATLIYVSTTNGQLVVGVNANVQGESILNPLSRATIGLDLVGADGSDGLGGSRYNDRLFGLAGNDTISGFEGDDLIYGDLGRDMLTGGAGADRFAYRNSADSPIAQMDVITDFQGGVDKLDFTFFGARGVARTGVGYKDGDAFVYVDINGDGVTDFGVALRGVTSFNMADLLL